MGNSGSSHREPPPSHSWTLSYPRNQKVLPERYPGQRLRVTNNGVLLHNVGTIQRHGYVYPMPIHSFGSEPDLRFTGRDFIGYNHESPAKQRISRSRKKYKAPPPVSNGMDSSSPDSYHQWDTSAENSEVQAPTRKSRLFKTHAETKAPTRFMKMPPLHRSLSTPQFHEELLEVTQKIRKRSKSPLHHHTTNNNNIIENKTNQLQNQNNNNHHVIISTNHNNNMATNNGNSHHILNNNNNNLSQMNSTNPLVPPRHHFIGGGGGVKEKQIQPNIIRTGIIDSKTFNNVICKDNMCEEDSHEDNIKDIVKQENVKNNWDNIKPVKTFYFGMEDDPSRNEEEDELNRFAAIVQRPLSSPSPATTTTSETVEEEPNNISLHLRPTLPRKQLDIPRFSPTAAWRLLSALESPTQSHSEDDDIVIPHVHDKSVDSGISGDASPHLDSAHNSQAAWTPQQDLEETSSDGGLESSPVTPDTIGMNNQFTLSLPRDNNSTKPSLTLLQTSNWMNNEPMTHHGSIVDENWVLSRSVPSSLHLQRWTDQDTEDSSNIQSLPYFAKAGRAMYLPDYQPSSYRVPHSMQEMSCFSKSLDDLVIQSQREREDMMMVEEPLPSSKPKKGKKFTFQSTVRQIERRKIAEKLSKQAEQKEKQRRVELETMNKVEAEFQRKREREKADIRQQLRLYTHVLSEYKQPSRDYKDYCPNSNRPEVIETPPSEVVHPQVVYQIPKNTQVYVVANSANSNNHRNSSPNPPSTLSDNSNYRRDFAQGVLPRSGSELSQPISHKSSSVDDISRDKFDPVVEEKTIKNESNLLTPMDKVEENGIKTFTSNEVSEEPKNKPVTKPSIVLTSLLTPFDRNKSYRPISFTPNPTYTQIAG